MPKGTIIDHLGDGEYTVTVKFDWHLANDAIAKLTQEINDQDRIDKRQALEDDHNLQVVILNVLIEELQLLIVELQGLEPGSDARIQKTLETTKKTTEGLKQRQVTDTALLLLHKANMELEAKEKELARLEAIDQTDPEVTAWACDFATGQTSTIYDPQITYPLHSGDVDLYIEHRESGPVAPWPIYHIPPKMQFVDIATAPTIIDPVVIPKTGELDNVGTMVAEELLDSAAIFWNLAMYPGFQRWMPILVTGSIDSLTELSANVLILPILGNLGQPLTGPAGIYKFFINYYCGPNAFDVDDLVVVKITSWADDVPTGQVIGFAENPKECPFLCGIWDPNNWQDGNPPRGGFFGGNAIEYQLYREIFGSSTKLRTEFFVNGTSTHNDIVNVIVSSTRRWSGPLDWSATVNTTEIFIDPFSPSLEESYTSSDNFLQTGTLTFPSQEEEIIYQFNVTCTTNFVRDSGGNWTTLELDSTNILQQSSIVTWTDEDNMQVISQRITDIFNNPQFVSGDPSGEYQHDFRRINDTVTREWIAGVFSETVVNISDTTITTKQSEPFTTQGWILNYDGVLLKTSDRVYTLISGTPGGTRTEKWVGPLVLSYPGPTAESFSDVC